MKTSCRHQIAKRVPFKICDASTCCSDSALCALYRTILVGNTQLFAPFLCLGHVQLISSTLRASIPHTMRLSSSSQRLQRTELKCSTSQRLAAPRTRPSSAAAAVPQQQQRQQRHSRPQQRQHQQQHPSWVARDAAAPAMASQSIDEDLGPSSLGPDMAQIVAYAMQLAWTGENYEVHTWMLLLGILKDERCAAAKVLQSLGLDDLYAAWHEVLWALNVADGLTPRAFTSRLSWAPGAYKVVNGAVRFAGWAGRDKVASHDLLMALAAAGTLEHLFPDLGMNFEAVRRAVQKETGDRYKLPDDDPADAGLQGQDFFL